MMSNNDDSNSVVSSDVKTMANNGAEFRTINATATATATPATSTDYTVHHSQPMMEYYYENQAAYNSQPNCFTFSSFSYPFIPRVPVKHDSNCFYYHLVNSSCYPWIPTSQYSRASGYVQNAHVTKPYFYKKPPSSSGRGDSSPSKNRRQSAKAAYQNFSNRMHPVQLLHQIFRKEAFVMEYERLNEGPFSQVRVTYKINGKSYMAEATRLKEARRLCAKQVLREQFPDLQIEPDTDIPRPEYNDGQFDNKHPVQILYQLFKYEPIEMQCEEEGAAHFAKHLFSFSIRGQQYQARAETIKEAKRRAAILVLNDYLKNEKEEGHV